MGETTGQRTLGEALSRYYSAQSLPPDGGENDSVFRIHVGPLTIPLPNPPARRAAVFYHDTNHVLTGYNNVFSDGEMVIAGFELGNGCGRFWIAWVINFFMFALGLAMVPRHLMDAYARGRRARSIYRSIESRDALRAMSVANVKRLVELDQNRGEPTVGELMEFAVWAFLGLATWAGAILLVVSPFVSFAR